MIKKINLFSFLVCFSVVVWAAEGPEGIKMPRQFTAEVVMTARGIKTVSKQFMDNDKFRIEVSQGGMSTINISRPDRQRVYIVMPAQKMYMEMPYNPTLTQGNPLASKEECQWESLGSEMVNGQDCNKYKVTVLAKQGATQSPACIYYIGKTSKLPVRIVARSVISKCSPMPAKCTLMSATTSPPRNA